MYTNILKIILLKIHSSFKLIFKTIIIVENRNNFNKDITYKDIHTKLI